MRFGLRSIFVAIAVLLFVIAVFSEERYADMLAWGLAAFALSFIVDELGLADRMGGTASTRRDTTP